MKLGGIYIGIGAKTTQLQTDLNKAKSMSVRAADKIEASLTKAFKSMAIAAAAASAAAGYAIKKAVDAASDLNETISKSENIFKGQSDNISNWAKDSASALGLSTQEALEQTATLGNMFKQLGAGTLIAADNSKQMVELASDVASFHNVAGGANDVLLAMQSAFRGEYDAVQRYIPTINAAAVQHEALTMTQKQSVKELTNLEKALAAQAIMMRDAGDAVGDFARTSDGLANQQRILESNIKDLWAELGQHFLPLVAEVAKEINDWIKANKDLIKVEIKAWVDNLKIAVGFLWDAVSTLWKLFSAIPKGVIEYFSNVAESSKQATTEVNKLSEAIKNIEPPPLTPWQEFIGLLDRWGKEIVDVFVFIKKSIGAVLGVIADTFASFVKLMVNELYYLNEAIGKALTLDFKGAKESLSQLGGVLNEWQTDTVRSWDAYEKTIYDAWDTMISNMEARLNIANLTPPSLITPLDTPTIEPLPPINPMEYPDIGGDITDADAKRQEELDKLVAHEEDKFNIAQEGWSNLDEALINRYGVLEMMDSDHKQVLLEQHKQYEDAKLEWTRRNHELTLSVTQGIFNNLMQLSQGHSKKIFKVMKIASIANAIVSTYAGAANALRDVPYPFNLVAAASVIASGMVQVQKIRAQTFDSGGGGGGGGGGASYGGDYISPNGEIPDIDDSEKRGSLTINIQGDMIGDEAYLEMLAEKISEAVEDRDIELVSSRAKYADALT